MPSKPSELNQVDLIVKVTGVPRRDALIFVIFMWSKVLMLELPVEETNAHVSAE